MKRVLITFLFLALGFSAAAQQGDSWEVSVNSMDSGRREMITRTAERMNESEDASRSILAAMSLAAAQAGTAVLVDVAATEIVRAVTYNRVRKKEWLRMIANECNYTDSLSSLRGLQDFYTEPSHLGALDPSNMNFDGISVRGTRDGREILYMSCHIDDSRLDHLFRHSKFFLVVDTLAFHPYNCHLPNLVANGIRSAENSDRDNSFSFNERRHLRIGMEMILSSSWVNEAVMVQKNVELGRFRFEVEIPSETEVYTYSKASAATPLVMQGDCFVVPRSFMPVSGGERMWGTGEYTMKVKFRESCQFSDDATANEKMKHWKKDYRALRKMQRKNGQRPGYFETLWEQNGDRMMKTVVKSGLDSGVREIKGI